MIFSVTVYITNLMSAEFQWQWCYINVICNSTIQTLSRNLKVRLARTLFSSKGYVINARSSIMYTTVKTTEQSLSRSCITWVHANLPSLPRFPWNKEYFLMWYDRYLLLIRILLICHIKHKSIFNCKTKFYTNTTFLPIFWPFLIPRIFSKYLIDEQYHSIRNLLKFINKI